MRLRMMEGQGFKPLLFSRTGEKAWATNRAGVGLWRRGFTMRCLSHGLGGLGQRFGSDHSGHTRRHRPKSQRRI